MHLDIASDLNESQYRRQAAKVALRLPFPSELRRLEPFYGHEKSQTMSVHDEVIPLTLSLDKCVVSASDLLDEGKKNVRQNGRRYF